METIVILLGEIKVLHLFIYSERDGGQAGEEQRVNPQ